MIRLYFPFAFVLLFIGWILYQLFIKKNLKQNLNNLYAGLFFTGIWLILYYFILT
jgi:hypothetical protein